MRPTCADCVQQRVPGRSIAWRTATAYAVVRTIRLCQARGALPGHAGMEVRGMHLHHHLYGFALLAVQSAMGHGGRCLHVPVRADALGTGLALVLDEFDVLAGAAEDQSWCVRVRAVLDVLSAAGVVGVVLTMRRTARGATAARAHRHASAASSRVAPRRGELCDDP